MKAFMGALLFCSYICACIAWAGFCLSKLWGWFVVPLGVRPINWAAAYGLAVIFYALKYSYKKTDPTETSKETTVKVIAGPLAWAWALLFGYLASTFAVFG